MPNYEYSISSGSASSAGGIAALLGGAMAMIIYLVIIALFIIAWWKLFTKAGKAGWTGIIPILNSLQLLDIAGKPWWWIFLMCIPVVDIVVLFLVAISIAKAFGKGAGFGVGLVILAPIFFLILAFGSAQYQRPADWPQPWLNI